MKPQLFSVEYCEIIEKMCSDMNEEEYIIIQQHLNKIFSIVYDKIIYEFENRIEDIILSVYYNYCAWCIDEHDGSMSYMGQLQYFLNQYFPKSEYIFSLVRILHEINKCDFNISKYSITNILDVLDAFIKVNSENGNFKYALVLTSDAREFFKEQFKTRNIKYDSYEDFMFIQNYVLHSMIKRKKSKETEYILYLDELISAHLINSNLNLEIV